MLLKKIFASFMTQKLWRFGEFAHIHLDAFFHKFRQLEGKKNDEGKFISAMRARSRKSRRRTRGWKVASFLARNPRPAVFFGASSN